MKDSNEIRLNGLPEGWHDRIFGTVVDSPYYYCPKCKEYQTSASLIYECCEHVVWKEDTSEYELEETEQTNEITPYCEVCGSILTIKERTDD